MLTGENGILSKADIAKETAKIKEYEEDLKMIGTYLQTEKITEQLTNKQYMDRYEEEINKKDDKYKKVYRKDSETIIVTTKEGYVFKITIKNVEYINKEGEIIPPNLQENDIEIKGNPSKWTKQAVTVEIVKKNQELEEYDIQYSTDGETWQNYEIPITVTNNCAIYARLWNGINAGGYTTGNITNIDRLSPNSFTPTAQSTIDTITPYYPTLFLK